jgi:hypothetical protein
MSARSGEKAKAVSGLVLTVRSEDQGPVLVADDVAGSEATPLVSGTDAGAGVASCALF